MAAKSPLDEYDDSEDLTFDEMLAVMLGLIGHSVSIGVSAAENTPPLTLTAVRMPERATQVDFCSEPGDDQEEFLFLPGEEDPDLTRPR